MEADDDFFVGYLSVEHDACAVLLGSAVRSFVTNDAESVDFTTDVGERFSYMYRSWALLDDFALPGQGENRFTVMPSAWECSVV